MKIRRISEFQSRLCFSDLDGAYEAYRSAFLNSELGQLYCAIPWKDFCKVFKLKEKTKGPKSIFSPQGKIALMFLKHYAGCSDRKLMNHLNANVDYQLFCDIYIPPQARLENYKIVSAIRCELARQLDISEAQQVLAQKWLPFMEELGSISCDATCYEASIRYPTDVKLLWEAVDWSHGWLKQLSKEQGIALMRSKYLKWKGRYISYSKMKQKRKKKRKVLKRSLLWLLDKINVELTSLELRSERCFPARYYRRRSAIKSMYLQQHALFNEGKKPKGRIVSIDKPYLRPIVRGKEKKPVEFGAKVNKLLIDGISFIEHLSFDAFNEGTRLIKSIFAAQRLTRRKVKLVGADAIYATNRNRKFVTKYNIKTDFKPKGRKPKDYKQHKILRAMITKDRASRLEGSFGTDKEHFLLKKNMARTKETEILLIFFGIHTSNAIKIGRRMTKMARKAA